MSDKYFADDTNVLLIASDMDGTLLDENSELPDQFWPLLELMEQRGILFVPASGRQYAALTRIFPEEKLGFIAENGNYVVLRGEEIFAGVLDRQVVEDVVHRMRSLSERNAGVVLCGKHVAYTERTDEAFLEEAAKYYANLEVVEDALAVDADFVKLAIFDFDSSAETRKHLADLEDDYQVVLSSPFWLDIMRLGVDKGTGLRELQRRVGADRSETVIFGDFHNDLPMFAQADHSFAVSNGHQDVLDEARFIIPSNREGGVLQVLTELLVK